MKRLRRKKEREPDPGESVGERYRTLFENSRDGIYVTTPKGRFLDANPALLHIVGRTHDELMGLSVAELYAEPELTRPVQDTVAQKGFVKNAEVRVRGRDGTERSCVVTMVAEKDEAGEVTGYHGIVHDVTEEGLAEERLRRATLYDALTQLPSRAYFLDRADRLRERLLFRTDYQFAVLSLKLDRFKLINDSMGHRAGDELLVEVAERLTILVRPEDIVARLAGDEFSILLLDLNGAEDAELICERIRDGLTQPFTVQGVDVYTKASIGIAMSDARYESAEEMVRDAGTAAYVAKREGVGGWAVFDRGMRERAVALLELENALRRGLERGEFLLYYQPIVAMSRTQVFGFEALLRWRHPVRGVLSPADFLAVAEESGLIVPLGDWALDEACRTLALWRAESRAAAPPVLSVNVSGRQLQLPGIAGRVRSLLEKHDIPGSALRIEITESVFLERSDSLMATLEELAGLGILLCLDDFGTGYSSLAFLRDLPVHVLKIDRSFVSQLTAGDGSDMIETILALARQLGLGTVAEGVETDAQRQELLRLGCEHAQGYLFARPVDGEQARALLADGVPSHEPAA